MQVLFFVFIIFCVRRSIDALYQENQPGSGSGKIRTGTGSRALRLTENVWHQTYENKKEGLQNYLELSFNSILNISYRLGYRALDPKFCQNRILIPATKTAIFISRDLTIGRATADSSVWFDVKWISAGKNLLFRSAWSDEPVLKEKRRERVAFGHEKEEEQGLMESRKL